MINQIQRLDYDNKALTANNNIINIILIFSHNIHATLFVNVVDNK